MSILAESLVVMILNLHLIHFGQTSLSMTDASFTFLNRVSAFSEVQTPTRWMNLSSVCVLKHDCLERPSLGVVSHLLFPHFVCFTYLVHILRSWISVDVYSL